MLTSEQHAYFQTFGFMVLRQVFTAAELKLLSKEYEKGLTSAYDHTPFDGKARQWAMQLGPETPFFAGLPEDPRFCEVAEQLYSEDIFPVCSDANRYVGNTRWHPDHLVDPTQDCYGIKFAYYLDPVGADSGALRVIPGSHRNPLHDEVGAYVKQEEVDVLDIPGYVCQSEPGDVVAFDVRLWHASWGGETGRRMCTVVYYRNPETPAEEAATRKRAKSSVKTPAQFDRPHDPLFHPHWVANPGGSPKRQRWIGRMRELGFFDALQM